MREAAQDRLALVCLALTYSLFLALLVNRYFPIQEGWFHYLALLINEGRTPYVDFDMFVPPLFPWFLAATTRLFGTMFLVTRLIGAAERVAILVVLYLWLRLLFPVRHAMVAALASVALYSSATTDLVYGYYQSCHLFCLLAGYLASRAAAGPDGGRLRQHLLAGVLAGVALQTKQSTGLLAGITLGAGLAAFLLARHGGRRALAVGLAFGAGFALPTALVLAALAAQGAVPAYWSQVYSEASGSKGGLAAVLFAFWARAATPGYVAPFLVFAAIAAAAWTARPAGSRARKFEAVAIAAASLAWLQQITAMRVLAAAALARAASFWGLPGDALFWAELLSSRWLAVALLAAAVALAAGRRNPTELRAAGPVPARAGPWDVPLVTAAAVACFLAPYCLPEESGKLFAALEGRTTKLIAVHGAFFATLTSSLALLVRLLAGREVRPELWLLALVSLAIGYAHGLSYALEEHAVVSGFALCVALAAAACERRRLPWLQAALYAGCGLIVALSATQRYGRPFDWFGWHEPDVRSARVALPMPELQGFVLSPGTAGVLTRVTALIAANSGPGDGVYTFPHMPLFDILAHRRAPTRAAVHYFDVCSDPCARRGAEELRRRPPKVVVYQDFPERVWTFHERGFRAGRPSGQREIQRLIDGWLRSGRYRLAARIAEPADFPLLVLVRAAPASVTRK